MIETLYLTPLLPVVYYMYMYERWKVAEKELEDGSNN